MNVQEIKKIFGNKKLNAFISDDMQFDIARVKNEKLQFSCSIKDMDANLIVLNNGAFLGTSPQVDQIIIRSFAEEKKANSELYQQYFNRFEFPKNQEEIAFNSEHVKDGVCIYVPDNVVVEKPIQLVNYIKHEQPQFIQTRFLVVLGKNSRMTLIQCNDSMNRESSFTQEMTEIYVAENAQLELIKMQNINNRSALINTTYFSQEKSSRVESTTISLNGGYISNRQHAELKGEHCESNFSGLYLTDKKQWIDNQVFVDHQAASCQSNQLFKGILDDYAQALFNGHVVVRPNAQQTVAFQNNKNILLTDKAKIETQPFLEIYADDVKCSHGASIGQLDENAMYYMRSRGISQSNARMLLMYAYADDIIRKINIPSMAFYIEDIVKKRLRGELSTCEHCVLMCNHPEN